MKISNTTRILAGLVLGAVCGLLLSHFDPEYAIGAADIVQPVGRLWLNALR